MLGWLKPDRSQDQPLGVRAERAAERYLKQQGYRVLARNLRNRFGEVDLLCEDRQRNMIVIVEVKAARSEDPPPEVHVNAAKQRKLTALAAQIVRRYRLENRSVRFDVVAIVWPDTAAEPSRLTHHESAFEAAF